MAARLTREEALEQLVDALDSLLTHYRTGTRPPDTLLERIRRMTAPLEPGVTHVAGIPVTIGGHRRRQRCGWCGHLLLDDDLARMQVAITADNPNPEPPGTWPIGGLVTVDTGNYPDGRLALRTGVVVEPEQGPDGPVPPRNACTELPDEATA